ncbi:MAG: hypothetical protein ACYC6X_01100 [Minisyncoccota bacterium]
MDLPRTIPTSFVPQPASAAARKFHSDFTGAFGFLAYAILGIILALAIGLFFYGRILDATRVAKDAQLTKAESAIDPATIQSFVQLRDRLDSGMMLLAGHIAFSNFFALLETLLPTPSRFNSLHLTVTDTKRISLQGTGVAKSFNALAAASNAFASDGRIKDAIFSNIVINKDNSVSFSLSASLDSSIVDFAPTSVVSSTAASASSTTPSP